MGVSIQARLTKIYLRLHFNRLMRHSYQEQRKIQENFNRRTAMIPRDIVFDSVNVNGIPGAWVNAPDSQTEGAILYFHGGAYYSGSIITHREFSARIVKATGLRLLLGDYRLAPEHPYPAAVKDATRAYRWLLSQGFDPAKIIVAGDSAGGGLALALLLALRAAGENLPAGAFCFSPWTDLTMSGESVARNAEVELMCKPEFLRQSARMYTQGYDLRTPLISPVFADLSGLPPLLIIVGTEETLLDDSTRLAARAQEAGVEVSLEIWPDMFHIFPIVGYMPEAKKALEKAGQFVHQRIGG